MKPLKKKFVPSTPRENKTIVDLPVVNNTTLSLIYERVDALLQLSDLFETEIERDDYDNGLSVMVCLGEIPDAYLKRTDLTKRERELLLEYQEALKSCRWHLTPKSSERVRDAAEQLRLLKHGIDLEVCFSEFFTFDEFAQPDFFKHSGIMVQTDRLRPDIFLEDC